MPRVGAAYCLSQLIPKYLSVVTIFFIYLMNYFLSVRVKLFSNLTVQTPASRHMLNLVIEPGFDLEIEVLTFQSFS